MEINIQYKKNKYRSLYIKAILIFLLLTLGEKSYSQSIITLTDSTITTFIGKSIYYLEDPNNIYTYPSITDSTYYPLYVKCNQDSPNFGNVENTIWNKCTIVNQSTKKWFLSVLNYNIDSLEFYYKNKDGTIYQSLSGSAYPLSTRKFKSGSYNFELPFAAGDTTTIYLRVKTYTLHYPLVIS